MSRNTCSEVALKTNKKKGGISALDQSEQSEREQSDFFMPWLMISSLKEQFDILRNTLICFFWPGVR